MSCECIELCMCKKTHRGYRVNKTCQINFLLFFSKCWVKINGNTFVIGTKRLWAGIDWIPSKLLDHKSRKQCFNRWKFNVTRQRLIFTFSTKPLKFNGLCYSLNILIEL